MTPQAVRKLAIVGVVLIVVAFVVKHVPIWQAWNLPQVNNGCHTWQGPAPISCTAVGYGELASGLVMLAGLGLAGWAALVLSARLVATWIRK
jgi:hypothetical protein